MFEIKRKFIQVSKIFLCLFELIKRGYSLTRSSLNSRYHIEEIDIKLNQVIIRCRYSRSFIKITLSDAIGSSGIIEHLPSLQACWLGYCYSISAHTYKNKEVFHPNHQLGFSLQMNKGRYKIAALNNRSNILTYLDIESGNTYQEDITKAAQSRNLIENIDPTQACYIGMQAGFRVANTKNESFDNDVNKAPLLRVVK